MKLKDVFSMGARNLLRRKTRTMLTVIGVIVGATSILLMVSLGIGMNESLERSIAQMGDLTLIELQQYTWTQNEGSNEYSQHENKLNDDMIEQIKQIDGVLAVTPVIEIYNYFKVIANGKYELSWCQMRGIDSEFLPYLNVQTEKGIMPVPGDKNFILFGSDRIYEFARIGKTIMNWYKEFYYSDGTRKPPKVDVTEASTLYAQGFIYDNDGYWNENGMWVENTSGRKAKFSKFYFDKVGIMKADTSNYETQYMTYADIELVKNLQLEIEKSQKSKTSVVDNYTYVKIKVEDIKSTEKVQKILSEDLGLTMSFNLSDIRKELQKTQGTLQMILGIIGAVALGVSAIGIANTMYMSIYERTKEIGVMKVLGCPLGGIKRMFLFEASTIGFLGGILGILLSKGASYAMNNIPFIYEALSSMSSNPYVYGAEAEKADISVIPLWLIGVTVIFATIMGLLAGYFPARRATKISALEAIHSE